MAGEGIAISDESLRSHTMETCRRATALALTLFCLLATLATPVRAEITINEFMAANSKTLADNDGEYSDWIELYNSDPTAVNLEGWFLTDDPQAPKLWQFPAVTIPARGYLLLFASGKDRRTPGSTLHTNFRLDADGEYLALVKPDGTSVTTVFSPAFPSQFEDVSYGTPAAASAAVSTTFLQTATPGAANSAARTASPAETVVFSRAPGPFTGQFTLTLSGAAPGQTIRYVLVSPSAAGATTPPVTSSSTQYSGPITINGSVIVKAAVFSGNNAAQGEATSAQYVKIGAAGTGTFTSGLPVLLIDNHGAGPWKKDNLNHPSWLYRYPPQASGVSPLAGSPDLAIPIDATVHGSSSTTFPQKSLGLDLRDAAGEKLALPLVGKTPSSHWTLITPWYFDPTFIKNSFVYTLSNRLGHWAPATQPVEVFLDTDGDLTDADYAGIYILTETIDINPDKVAITPLGSGPGADVTGGYIIKLDEPDPDEFSWSTTRDVPGGASAVVVASTKAASLSVAEKDYIRNYVQQMEDALVADFDRGFATHSYLDYIDRASWVDFHLINVLVGNYDAFERSAYYSKDRGGKLVAGPLWDFDRSFGAATFDDTMPWDQWSHPTHINYWQTGWWGYLAHDPEFMQDWVDRWQSLRQGLLATGRLTALADSLSAAIGPQPMARDAARWPTDSPELAKGRTGGLSAMKAWMTSRGDWIDRQFVGAPSLTTGGATTITFAPPPGAQLAYTLDGSDPRSLGGRVAPNAQLTATALTVPATANVHVRSYRADRATVFPGTPWSMAVSGPNATPLSPVARLVNLSARALVGTGENSLIAGVVATDTAQKNYLIRGVGPGLTAFGAGNVLPAPQLSIWRSDGVQIYANTGWQNAPEAADLPAISRSVGAFPLSPGSRDSALMPTLPAGLYTVRVSGNSTQSGVGLAELYETNANGRTTNLSARANVQPGEGSLTGGLYIQGPAYKRVLVRGVGPGLRPLGVTNALADPVLTVYSGQTVVASNDAWSSGTAAPSVSAAASAVGAFALPAGSQDAALLITLPPGPYTVEVKGKGSATGVALIEIYDVP
jgi:hypothetical protein